MTRIVVHALHGVDPPVVARITAQPKELREAAAGLPDGAATAEAVAVRLRRTGTELVWGDPVRMDGKALLRFCRDRGASSLALVRADPSLLPDLQLGTWFRVFTLPRIVRRVAIAARVPPSLLHSAAEAAFWGGVRAAATRHEWRRLTQSSYVVLCYHRIAGEGKPGQERLDVSPEVFERHMRWLRRLGLAPLGVDDVIRFHTDPAATLPRRGVLVTADDGFRDAILALQRHVDLRPIVFVSTAAVGGSAPWDWADGEQIASWPELQDFVARGGEVGSHTRTHAALPELGAEALVAELTGSWRELEAHVSRPSPLLAYPHGRNDAASRAAAAAGAYDAAFTTEAGRNGAGTDRYRLRRIEPKEWDGPAAFAWKVLTGEAVPWAIERRRRRRR
jgi:peptidoglycan/xylan/chitin deacetylase (PgdA/CDA1 family)